jgi:hypothetical protein
MRSIYLALLLLALPVVASGCAGCAWLGAHQGIEYDTSKGLVPYNGPGYMDGVPQDMRAAQGSPSKT